MVQFVPEIVSYVLVRFFFLRSPLWLEVENFDQQEYAFLSLTHNIQVICTLFTWSKWNLKLPFSDDEK